MDLSLASATAAALRALPAAALTSGASTVNPLLWYVTRAAAVSAYVTLTATVLLGIWRSLARVARIRTPWTLDEAHQFLAVLTAGFVALHLIALVFDPLIPFSLLNLLLPIAEPYRWFAVDLGVLSLYALVVVLLSSWLRRYIAHARWRTLHYTGFVAFCLITLHGLLAGSDAGQAWMRLVYLGASVGVGALVVFRLLSPSQPAQAQGGLSGQRLTTPAPRRAAHARPGR